jgi:hypothetical protein
VHLSTPERLTGSAVEAGRLREGGRHEAAGWANLRLRLLVYSEMRTVMPSTDTVGKWFPGGLLASSRPAFLYWKTLLHYCWNSRPKWQDAEAFRAPARRGPYL